MHPYERILVPVDFSDASIRAAKRAVQLAPDDGAVDLLHVTRIPTPVVTPAAEVPVDASVMTDAHQNQEILESELRGLYEILQPLNPKVRMSARVRFGEPAPVIVEESKGHDLIVMGASNRGRLSKLLLGSVANKTVREAKCAVLIERVESE